MANIIIIAILVVITTSIVIYLFENKRREENCTGCPYAGRCGGSCSTDYKRK